MNPRTVRQHSTLLPIALGVAGFLSSGAAPVAAAPTFSKDVAPIVFKSCAECHRPGSIAPMSLLTYDDVRTRD